MQTDLERNDQELIYKLRTLIEQLDVAVFREIKLLGIHSLACPVITSTTPEELPHMDSMSIATIFSYKHGTPLTTWNNFWYGDAYFIWTSAVAGLISRLRKGDILPLSTIEHRLALLATILVRKRIICHAEQFSRFRYYAHHDLPLESQSVIFTNSFFGDSFVAKDYECVDQLVLYELFCKKLNENVDWADRVSPLIVDILLNRAKLD